MWDIAFSGKYTARDGDPLNRTNVFSFASPTLTQPSETVRVATRGTDRTETVDQFLDLRLSKRSASASPTSSCRSTCSTS